jgi:acyl-CoA synthetase (NDP forming)
LPLLSRLLRPRSIAVVGGGAWCAAVIEQCRRMSDDRLLWPVHPDKSYVGGVPAIKNLGDLPCVPDATFIGVNRNTTIKILRQLSEMDAGGAVCFASGFSEVDDGNVLQTDLMEAAGDMPFLGPNCYGFLNYVDGAVLWPDQHGGERVENGVAILTQSSNIALNLTMQKRGLPIAYMVTTGNQAQQNFASVGLDLLSDDRVTALGLHIEGFGDIREIEELAKTARRLNKPIIALKVGKSEQARSAAISHTASLAGEDAGAQALMDRLGIGRVDTLAEFLETLKLLHVHGKLSENRVASLSCSGGEASLVADAGLEKGIVFPSLSSGQAVQLKKTLGSHVNIANPLDYHTNIWRDFDALCAVFSTMTGPNIDITMIVLDFPDENKCDHTDWEITVDAVITAAANTGCRYAVVSSLPDTMPEVISKRLMHSGIVALSGIEEAFVAIRIAASKSVDKAPILIPDIASGGASLSEWEAKQIVAHFGLQVPRALFAENQLEAKSKAETIGFPIVLKGHGIAHKTDCGAVALNLLNSDAVARKAHAMPTNKYLVEEMITGGVAELLIGIVHDAAHGFVLTLAAGGALTEVLQDRQSLLLPVTESEIDMALNHLKIAPVLNGYRGQPATDKKTIIESVMALQNFVIAHGDMIEEIEINPLLCTETSAIAVDVLIRGETKMMGKVLDGRSN